MAYGFLVANSNDVMQSTQGLFLLSSRNGSSLGENGLYACNMKQSITLFCVRALLKSNWINHHDVYIGMGKINE
jgi:hypothetical protein